MIHTWYWNNNKLYSNLDFCEIVAMGKQKILLWWEKKFGNILSVINFVKIIYKISCSHIQNLPQHFEITWNTLQIYVTNKVFSNIYIVFTSQNLPHKLYIKLFLHSSSRDKVYKWNKIIFNFFFCWCWFRWFKALLHRISSNISWILS